MDVVLKKKKDMYFLFKSLFKVQITSNDNFNFFLKKKKKKNHLVTLIQEKKKTKCPTILFRLCSVYKNSKLKIFKFSSDTKIRSVP